MPLFPRDETPFLSIPRSLARKKEDARVHPPIMPDPITMVAQSGGGVNRLLERRLVQRFPAIDAAQGELPRGHLGPEQHGRRVRVGQRELFRSHTQRTQRRLKRTGRLSPDRVRRLCAALIPSTSLSATSFVACGTLKLLQNGEEIWRRKVSVLPERLSPRTRFVTTPSHLEPRLISD